MSTTPEQRARRKIDHKLDQCGWAVQEMQQNKHLSYRLIKFAQAKRVLLLVGRNNLRRQTINDRPQHPAEEPATVLLAKLRDSHTVIAHTAPCSRARRGRCQNVYV